LQIFDRILQVLKILILPSVFNLSSQKWENLFSATNFACWGKNFPTIAPIEVRWYGKVQHTGTSLAHITINKAYCYFFSESHKIKY